MSMAREALEPPKSHHLMLLALSVGMITLSLLLRPLDERRIAVEGLTRFPLPELCQSRVWLGIECPGCGLTRSFIHFFHGRWEESVRMHRIGWLLALLVVVQIPYRLVALVTSLSNPLGRTLPRAVSYGLVALLSVNWLLKLAGI